MVEQLLHARDLRRAPAAAVPDRASGSLRASARRRGERLRPAYVVQLRAALPRAGGRAVYGYVRLAQTSSGRRRVRRRSSRSRPRADRASRSTRRWRRSPIHYLLVIHLLQNVMIADWAPPLLVLGPDPGDAGRGRRARRARARVRHAAALRAAPSGSPSGTASTCRPSTTAPCAIRWPLNIEHGLLILAGLVFWWPVFATRAAAGLDRRSASSTSARPTSARPSSRSR